MPVEARAYPRPLPNPEWLGTPIEEILEFTHRMMRPTAGLVFVGRGADVIKFEPAPKGEHTRGLGGLAPGFVLASAVDRA